MWAEFSIKLNNTQADGIHSANKEEPMKKHYCLMMRPIESRGHKIECRRYGKGTWCITPYDTRKDANSQRSYLREIGFECKLVVLPVTVFEKCWQDEKEGKRHF